MRNTGKAIAIPLSLAVCVIAVVLAVGGTSYGSSGYLTTFNTTYGTAGTRLDTCTLCHIGTPSPRNNFGSNFASNGHVFNATLNNMDSDGDGFTNLEEITALTFPGDATDFPAAALTITTVSPLPSGTVGTAYNQLLEAAGGTAPYSWSVTAGALPAGLNLSAAGVVSGTPTAAGTFNFTAQVVGGGTVTKAFDITIDALADTTPPTVQSTVPDNNATGVAVTTTVSATFDEAIDPATVNNTSFFVTNGVDNVIGTLNVSGSTATFTPSAALADNTVYTATLTAATDLAGNPLAADYTWSFTTAVPASSSGGGGSGGGCSVIGAGRYEGGGAILFLTLLAILVTLRRNGARARR
jgi:hypothetical protein